jgi:bifunctional DNase/RNase
MALPKDMSARRMEIQGLMMDPDSRTPVIVLKEIDGEAILPIWIGAFEANAIAMSLEGIEPPRPMTHDLLSELLKATGAKVEKVVVSDLSDGTFFASIHLSPAAGGEGLSVDARPSDAIALALRAKAPIFVFDWVIEAAQSADLAKEALEKDRLQKWLEEVAPDDLGDYEM